MNSIDLHLHSEHSDGTSSVLDILAEAKKKKLRLFSICDHDCFTAYETLQELPKELIKGAELSAFDPIAEKVVHVLAYDYQQTHHMKQICEPTIQQMVHISKWQVEQLQQAGYQITWEEVCEKAKNSTSVYKQHIMDVMIQHGYATEIYDTTYQKLFKNNGICMHEKTFPNIKDVIQAILSDQGIAIIAHPCVSKVEKEIPRYLTYGAMGIETYHSAHTMEQIQRLHDLAQAYHLIETGGSDHHGRYGEEPEIGKVQACMPEKDVETCIKNFMNKAKK